MLFLTEDAKLRCKHVKGRITVKARQSWVSIVGRNILVDDDPEGRPVRGCPNIGPTIKPCTHTLRVKAGYSDLVRIDGRRVCLDTVSGLTDGTPPGLVKYEVEDSGQNFVKESI